ncbi:palmdelphin isoform X4 [Anguilla anguilla]|uniref:palmdelphin isoform X4 n=1 Tax=Anguilla anguilla TaxID=7936 RepID=UPI0015ADFF09|nr:palmdelphin isoform X4 [Anguilla anguilla]
MASRNRLNLMATTSSQITEKSQPCPVSHNRPCGLLNDHIQENMSNQRWYRTQCACNMCPLCGDREGDCSEVSLYSFAQDKRKIQEDIAKKRRDIEEEKLKLQYLKKKALREQWLMDGLSLQSAQEEEAMRLQAQDDQQQSKVLQSNIERMEMEIEALEKQEMTISENEQLILKRLKEVEKTTEDIIKAVNADTQQEPIQYIYSEIPDIPKSYKPSQLKKLSSPFLEPNDDQPKQALFAMEINVEKDMRTGESQVLSTATVTPQKFQQKGIKVYDDGRKSVYALGPDGQLAHNGVGELTPREVEELLRKATEKQTDPDVEYHEPVFSAPYSRPATPKRPNRDHSSPRPSGLSEAAAVRPPSAQPEVPQSDGALFQREAKHLSPHIPHPNAGSQAHADQSPPHSPGKSHFTNGGETHLEANAQKPVQTPLQQSKENHRAALLVKSEARHRSPSPSLPDASQTTNTAMPAEPDSTEPVTMIFMGYQSVDDEQETRVVLRHDGVIQAELVVIGDDDENGSDGPLSFHPDGCHSKIFQPHLASRASSYLTEAKASCNRTNASLYATPSLPQETELGHSPIRLSPCPDAQVGGDSTEDPSLTAEASEVKEQC